MTTFNYAARDYDTIKTDLIARAERVMPEWTDRDPSDFGMLLLDLWAMMGDVQHYYIDRAATEAFLETATQRESVLSIARLLDYSPVGRSSATGTVTVDNTTLADYLVAKDTHFVARANDKTYTVHAREGQTISATTSAAVQVGEGEIIEDEVLTDSASGLPGQVYAVGNIGCAPATLRIDVYEDGVTAVPYTFVTSLSKAQAGARVFSSQLGADNFTEVLFGTDVNGYVPPTGSTITATYASCSGAEGNLAANTVTSFEVSPGAGISVVSSTALSGGADAESISSMKQSIPSVVSAQDRAVTYNDFVNLTVAIPGVAKAALEYTPGAAGAVQSTVDRQITNGVATVEVTGHGYSDGDAVRVDAVGREGSISDLTITSGVATVTSTSHPFLDGERVLIFGVTFNTALNGVHTISNVLTNSFDFVTGEDDDAGPNAAGTVRSTDYDGVHVISGVTTDTFSFTSNGANESETADANGTVFLVGDSTAKMYVQENRSDYLTTTDTFQTASPSLRTTVEDTVQEKALLGTTVTTAATINWESIDVSATVYVNQRAVTNTVSAAVSDALDELFQFDNVHFGQLLHLGQIHRIVLNQNGVDYVDVTKFDVSTAGPTSVQNTIQINDYELPKKGTYALTYVGGISTS